MSIVQPIPILKPASPRADDFLLEKLGKYRGRWVALSADGERIIAGEVSLKALDQQVRAAGLNPEDVFLEWVPPGDCVSSGLELS